MKIHLFWSIILASGLGMGQAVLAATNTSVTWPIRIAIVSEPINLIATVYPMHFGWVRLNSNVFSNQTEGEPRCTLHNRGYATVDYTVSAGINGTWALGTAIGDVGTDRCVIAAIFTRPLAEIAVPGEDQYVRWLTVGDFANNDVVGPSPRVASTTDLASDNSGAYPYDQEYFKGYNILPTPNQPERSLRFMVQTPTWDSSGGQDQEIYITIGAIVK